MLNRYRFGQLLPLPSHLHLFLTLLITIRLRRLKRLPVHRPILLQLQRRIRPYFMYPHRIQRRTRLLRHTPAQLLLDELALHYLPWQLQPQLPEIPPLFQIPPKRPQLRLQPVTVQVYIPPNLHITSLFAARTPPCPPPSRPPTSTHTYSPLAATTPPRTGDSTVGCS
jgi:hypothetical protein